MSLSGVLFIGLHGQPLPPQGLCSNLFSGFSSLSSGHPSLNAPNLCCPQVVGHLRADPAGHSLKEAEVVVDLLVALWHENQAKAEVRASPQAAHSPHTGPFTLPISP